jgi:hypothetical protein
MVCDVRTFEHNFAFIGSNHAHYHPEGRSLAGTVPAEQTNDASLLNAYRNLVYNGSAGIFLY